MENIFEFILGLPMIAKALIGLMLIGIVISFIKKFVKLAIYLAIITLIAIFIMRLFNVGIG